jgi:chemotaxis protein MotB
VADSLAKTTAAIAILGSAVGGIYAAHRVARANADAADVAVENGAKSRDLAECLKARDEEKKAREESELVAADASAILTASRAELEELRTQRAESEKRLAAFKAMTDKFRKMIDSGKLQVILKHGRMVVKLPAGILFASGSSDISKDGQTALTEVASILKQFPDRRFMVAGHTDNVPVGPPSPFKNNLELSTARALTVVAQLVSAGMNASRLVAAGYAEFEPVRENASEAGRQENRRIEIVLLPNLAELPPMPDLDGGVADAHAKK